MRSGQARGQLSSDELRRARHARYNASVKGMARRRRYEDKHPERRERWPVIMRVKARDRR